MRVLHTSPANASGGISGNRTTLFYIVAWKLVAAVSMRAERSTHVIS
jgi:hypothetical protein